MTDEASSAAFVTIAATKQRAGNLLDHSPVGGRMEQDADMDAVDRIILAWATERPDIDLFPMHIFSRVSRLALKTDRRTHATLHALDRKRSEAEVLHSLTGAGFSHERSAGDLARECYVTTGTLTKRIERLIRREFVTRVQAGADGRVVTIRLTPTGKHAADRAMSASLAIRSISLSGLTKSELRQLVGLLRTISIEADPS